jgi:nucleoside-diphosphate-sugar epimerase/predicted dehydrogenase
LIFVDIKKVGIGMSRIGLVGAGFISRVHADALKAMPGQQLACVIDPNREAAERLARDYGVAASFASVQEALDADAFDRAHVLVPPDLHCRTALPLIAAGKPVLLEKPLAVNGTECDALIAASAAHATPVGVNQNFVHHPAFVQLSRLVESGAYGRPNFIGCVYNVPLRQLKGRQFGHWMFREPGNILLEQAVHPLSQIVTLAGAVGDIAAISGKPMEIAPGVPFVGSVNVSLACARLPAQLRLAVGQEFPFWQITAVCDDGVVVADILANRVITHGRTRWLEALDGAVSGVSTAFGVARHSVGNLVNYGLSTAKLKAKADPFFLSMKGSLSAFHTALDAGRVPALDAAFGASLVAVCARIADQVFPKAASVTRASQADTPCDVAVIGGTGFIGTHLVNRLVAEGMRVSVMARGVVNLDAIFSNPNVVLQRGDIRDEAAVRRAIGTAPIVVNLAHGGGGSDFAAIKAAMVGGAEIVARACQAAAVRRLIHVGSIASLYCGPQPGVITGSTLPDPQESERGDYARAKVLADRMLLEMHARQGLPVVILRPGLVVGEGTSPFHSGLGFYNTEQHCIGWNDGRNPLPFVLVEDVASAILGAMRADHIEGRCYNIVGDVRMTARDYTETLAHALGRPLHYHPQSPRFLWTEDTGKWLVKRATGRNVAAPSMRDFLSRGLMARFDCTDAQKDLGWSPVADRDAFIAQAITVHAGE